jgi:peptidoglycan/LPS O-acetylase OafA/YrhL
MSTTIGLWTGVDVFLCISGFVITKAFSAAIRLAAEGRRAWPAETNRFLVSSRFSFVADIPILNPCRLFGVTFFNRSGAFGSPASDLQDAAAIFLSVANFYFSACSTGAVTGCGPNGIYWTVSLEQQFYVLFAALILLRDWMMVIIRLLIFLFWR